MWVCGQYWPSFELAEIAIADEGIGIYNSITQNHAHEEYITDNEKALQWALKLVFQKHLYRQGSKKVAMNGQIQDSAFIWSMKSVSI